MGHASGEVAKNISNSDAQAADAGLAAALAGFHRDDLRVIHVGTVVEIGGRVKRARSVILRTHVPKQDVVCWLFFIIDFLEAIS